MAIMQLKEKNKLNYDDTIDNYIPDYPEGQKITIRHLLTHTSGIWSFTDDPDYVKQSVFPNTVDEVIARFKNKSLEFTPGAKYQYSNSGYFLLGKLIEVISKESYKSFIQTNILDPLDMKDTLVEQEYQTIIPNRASGYQYNKKQRMS